ncbi:hypothetical protein [Streptomyces sp. I6]|uniref:hypothetical protein n=1 Tax=Streptomyces sp. I6 TaxID=2483113 RepID=UPI0028805662|nr:hypothetical protein [Streptomyces sp. I6]
MGRPHAGRWRGRRATRHCGHGPAAKYDPQPLCDAGSPEKAPERMVAQWRTRDGLALGADA